MRKKSLILLTWVAIALSCIPLSSLRSQTRPLPAVDYANEIYYYDTAVNTTLKLETGTFIPSGNAWQVYSGDRSASLENKTSPVRISNHRPSFLMKLRSPDIDPTNYIAFSALKPFKKSRFVIWARGASSYNPTNEIKSWTIKKVAPDLVMLTPPAPLPGGEYSFYFLAGVVPRAAFAFGID